MLLQCSGSTASVDLSFKHDVTALEKYLDLKETENASCKADSIRPPDDSTKQERLSGHVLCHDDEVSFSIFYHSFVLKEELQ